MTTPPPSPEALYQLYFLLANHYPRPAALNLVASRHTLTRPQRILLSRCIHPPSINKATRNKLVKPDRIKDSCLAVDTINQLATIYAALTGDNAYRCSDGLTRDALLGAARQVIRHREPLAAITAPILAALRPAKLILVIDSQPSRSAQLAKTLTNAARSEAINAETILTPRADTELIKLSTRCIIASSDTVIAQKATKLFDLALHAITTLGAARAITDITQKLATEHQKWCSGGPVA